MVYVHKFFLSLYLATQNSNSKFEWIQMDSSRWKPDLVYNLVNSSKWIRIVMRFPECGCDVEEAIGTVDLLEWFPSIAFLISVLMTCICICNPNVESWCDFFYTPRKYGRSLPNPSIHAFSLWPRRVVYRCRLLCPWKSKFYCNNHDSSTVKEPHRISFSACWKHLEIFLEFIWNLRPPARGFLDSNVLRCVVFLDEHLEYY